MSGHEVKEALSAEPFIPLQFSLSSGDTFIIRNPDLCILTKQGALHVYHPVQHEFAQADGFTRVSLGQITRIVEIRDLAA